MKRKIPKILLLAFLILFACIQLYPLVWLLLYSLKSNAEILGDNIVGLPQRWQWENYQRALTASEIPRYFMNSVIFSLVTVMVVGLLSAMAAYGIARMRWKLSGLTLTVFSIGIMIPAHAALLPLFQVLNTLELKGGYLGLALPYIAFALPMSVMVLTGFYRSIPHELEESAYIDGCGVYKTFLYIIFPIIKPALATASIFTFLNTWNELLFATTLLDNNLYYTLPVGISAFSGVYTTKLGMVGAGLVVATLPSIIIYTLLSNKIQESLVSGAVKG